MPVQVASHAQKYFIRLNSLNKKDKRRSSIHDITSPAGEHLYVCCKQYKYGVFLYTKCKPSQSEALVLHLPLVHEHRESVISTMV